MATRNVKTRTPAPKTHEGGLAKHINSEQQLRRSVMACLLWEDTFYESGVAIAQRIQDLVPSVKPEKVAEMAIQAREQMKLRHAPLMVVRAMTKSKDHNALVASTLERIIQRPDELTEFMAIYWNGGACKGQSLTRQAKLGLARAFRKFPEYSLAKYNRDKDVTLKDVMFLSHPKPKNQEQAALWKRLIDGKMKTPDTWEVALSAGKGKDKGRDWERLLNERKLGAMALLRNLRNMQQAGVDEKLVIEALKNIKVERVLPYRFIAAARYAPRLEPYLETAMYKCVEGKEKLAGKTILLVDVSGSMDVPVSQKSDMNRIDAACGMAILARELCENVIVFTFSNNAVEVPARRGFALRDAIYRSQIHGGTYLAGALSKIERLSYDRLIVITDEQAHDNVGDPKGNGYIINVAAYKNGVGYGKWNHIDGWSEAILDYINVFEKDTLAVD